MSLAVPRQLESHIFEDRGRFGNCVTSYHGTRIAEQPLVALSATPTQGKPICFMPQLHTVQNPFSASTPPLYYPPVNHVAPGGQAIASASTSIVNPNSQNQYTTDSNTKRIVNEDSDAALFGSAIGSINPHALSSGQTVQPRNVLVKIDGDVGALLSQVPEKPVLADKVHHSNTLHAISVVDNQEPPKGFTIDYYGLARDDAATTMPESSRVGGIGWDATPSGGRGSVSGSSTNYCCQLCGLTWIGVPLQDRMFRSGIKAERERQRLLPPQTPATLSFSRPNVAEFHWYLDVDTGDEPCIRGLSVQGCPPSKFRADTRAYCCPPGVDKTILIDLWRCFFDNCPYITSSVPEMKNHLMRQRHHRKYMEGLIKRVRASTYLSYQDLEMCHRAQKIFNDRDAAGKYQVSNSRRTVLEPEQMKNPPSIAQHAQWLEYLSPTIQEPKYQYYHDGLGVLWRRVYSMDAEPEHAAKQHHERVELDPMTGAIIPPRKKNRTFR